MEKISETEMPRISQRSDQAEIVSRVIIGKIMPQMQDLTGIIQVMIISADERRPEKRSLIFTTKIKLQEFPTRSSPSKWPDMSRRIKTAP